MPDIADIQSKVATLVTDPQFKIGGHGERAGSATAVQLPNVPCRYVNIKADNDNAGTVYLGASASVTAKAGTTTTTAGFPLAASEETGWLPVSNLNEIYMICANAGDDVMYWTLV
jgi:hypothetical protein